MSKIVKVYCNDGETLADLVEFFCNYPEDISMSGCSEWEHVEIEVEDGKLAELNRELINGGFQPISERGKRYQDESGQE